MIQLGAGQEHTVPLFDKKGQHTGELKFKAQEEQGGSSGAGSGAGQTAGMAGAAGAAAAGAHHNRDRDVADSGRDGKTAHLHKVFQVIHHYHHTSKPNREQPVALLASCLPLSICSLTEPEGLLNKLLERHQTVCADDVLMCNVQDKTREAETRASAGARDGRDGRTSELHKVRLSYQTLYQQ